MVSETSIKAFYRNKKELETLQDKTLYALEKFVGKNGFSPTCKELQKYMIQEFQDISWRKQVQPRLTDELHKQGKVRPDGSRKCEVSNNEAQTWKPTKKGRGNLL